MEKMEIGKSGVVASSLSFGTFGIGGGTAWADTAGDEKRYIDLIHAAHDMGIDFFDTAPVYGTGNGEEILGRAIAGRRADYVIGTKCSLHWRGGQDTHEYMRDGHDVRRCFEPASLRADLEDSLRRLGTDYIDVYICHRQPPVEEVAGIMDTLLSFKKEGKIRAIGISNGSPEHLAGYLQVGQVDLVQEQLSLLTRGRLTGYVPLCEKNGVTFQTYKALEEGALTGKIAADFVPAPGDVRNGVKWFRPEHYARVCRMLERFEPLCEKYGCSKAVLALAWLRAQSGCINLLVGSRRAETLRDTVQVLDIKLSAQDCAFMQAQAEALDA